MTDFNDDGTLTGRLVSDETVELNRSRYVALLLSIDDLKAQLVRVQAERDIANKALYLMELGQAATKMGALRRAEKLLATRAKESSNG